MTYTEAVQKALNGEESGFGFLYENTYKSKLYLCIQYMKNESDAEDVLQDAYVKAFTSLQSLQNPEKFSSWLGQIVANTAKNALVKKNPVLFSYIPTESDEDESYEEQIEDENVSNQPELSYTREETRQMVQELIDSLSDEQRMCILMYHMEDMPIKDIAATLNCSESTVKSRLNYGRKNLKAKAEEMEKKGYKLYSIAPLALLLLLLHTDAQAMYTEPAFLAAGRQVSNHVFSQISSLGYGPGSGNSRTGSGDNSGTNSRTNSGASRGQTSAADSTAVSNASGAESAAKSRTKRATAAGILSTRTGQILIGVIGAAVLAGTGFGISTLVRDNNEENNRKQGGPVVVVQDAEDAAAEAPEETVETRVVTDDMYPDLLEGELTKSHFEELLGYAPVGMTNGQVSSKEMASILDDLSVDSFLRFSDSSEKLLGVEGSYRYQPSDVRGDINGYYDYNLDQMNNYLSVLTSTPLTNENLYKWDISEFNNTISGNTLSVVSTDGDYGLSQQASITDAVQSGDTMTINFSVDLYDTVKETQEDRYAILKKQDDGHYRIDSISLGTMDISSIIEQSDEQSSQQVSVNTIKEVYKQVLSDVQAGKYTFSYANATFELDGTSEGYQYFLRDLDNDGIQDLIVAEVYCPNSYTGVGVFFWNDCLIFTAQQQNGSWSAKQIDEIDILSAFIPSDGNGIDVMTDYGRGTGEAEYHRITIVNGALSIGGYTDETDGTLVEWYDINDLSGLSGID